ncbi:MAG: AAA family ATPase, partial [Gammaproteobacteria bacterium]
MNAILAALRGADLINDLDRAFGAWIAERSNESCGLAAAFASAEVGKGHVCLDLDTAVELLRTRDIEPPRAWAKTLGAGETVAVPGERAPLVLDGNRLYLHRYWIYETRIAQALRDLATPVKNVDAATLQKALREQFRDAGDGRLDRQALAAVIGATRRLAILSGGPGTGKTYTIFKLIALALALTPELRIALAAPTGKAASRLNEVIGNNVPTELREHLPEEPRTLHRLLGYNAARQTIRHDAANPLPFDLVVVDEASMVDIGLMARLLAALKPDARLVLVGDRDQLASVEAGAVLGDICSVADGFDADEAERLEMLLGAAVPRAKGAVSTVSGSIALLKRNYRFGEGPIGHFAKAVIAGDTAAALRLL